MESYPFLEDAKNALLLIGFCLPRLLAVLMILPVFSGQILTGITRAGIAVSLTLFIYPIVASGAPQIEELGAVVAGAILLKELVIGLLIGFSVAAIFWAIESVGFVIDNQRGASMASSMDPMTGTQTSPLGVLFTQAFIALFFVGGGFLALLGALYESYLFWPVFSYYPNLNLAGADHFLGVLDMVVMLTVLLAAPVALAMFLSEYGLGLISRFAPQLNVFFLAMPVKSAVGMLFLVFYLGVVLRFFGDEMRAIPVTFELLRGLLG